MNPKIDCITDCWFLLTICVLSSFLTLFLVSLWACMLTFIYLHCQAPPSMFCRGRYKNSGDWLIDWCMSAGRQFSDQSLFASLSISLPGAYRSSCQSYACLPGASWRRRSDAVAPRYTPFLRYRDPGGFVEWTGLWIVGSLELIRFRWW